MVAALRALAVLPAALAVSAAVPFASSFAATPCDFYASPEGSDDDPGSLELPYRTAQRLVARLQPGNVGCLREGAYEGGVHFDAAGTAAAPIALTSFPGELATVVGRVQIREGADFVSVVSLALDGRNQHDLPSPAVSGDDAVFAGNDVTNANTAICFDLGPTTYGRANRTLLRGNRIHDCGTLPATNHQHGIYVEHASDAVIVDNLVHDNADRGINLYPDAQGSYIARNIVDGNGEGVLIGGGVEEFGPQASSGNLIEHNVITNSTERYNVEAFWGSALVGERNVVRRNCIYGGARAAHNRGLAPPIGFTAVENLLVDPLYVDPLVNDFSLSPGSPCALAGGELPAGATATVDGVPPVPALAVPGNRTRPAAAPRRRLGRSWRPIIREHTARVRRRSRRARRRKEPRLRQLPRTRSSVPHAGVVRSRLTRGETLARKRSPASPW